jgi:hypothetical protein
MEEFKFMFLNIINTLFTLVIVDGPINIKRVKTFLFLDGRIQDGRIQVYGSKIYQHVIYARHCRWLNIHKKELIHLYFYFK